MASSAAAMSQTLQSITLTKIKELEKHQAKYESQKKEALQGADQQGDQRMRIAKLLRGVLDLYPGASDEAEITNIQLWLNQAEYDVSVPNELIKSYETLLREKLEIESRRLGLGHLYARLVQEWMSASANDEAAAASEAESFEVVDRQKERLKELCEKFERVVFEPLVTDEDEIEKYLVNVFKAKKDDIGVKALSNMKQGMGSTCKDLFDNSSPFTSTEVERCIDGLLVEDLLSDEKQGILRGFLTSPEVLGEMADLLNMRFSDILNWHWDAGESGIPVLPRQQLNGKYRIWMDEDVLQAILIHYVGIHLCIHVKVELKAFINCSHSIWKWHAGAYPAAKEKERLHYYMMVDKFKYPPHNVNDERKNQYLTRFFAAQLPDSFESVGFTQYDNDEATGNAKAKPENIKQKLLQTIASEVLLHQHLGGEVVLIQTDLEWFATGLSHSTIFAVMRFVGFSPDVIDFFRKVLQAPLNVQSSPDSTDSKGPRIRRRGVPMAHAPEKLIGELILFVMDLVVNQEDGVLLYRMHDDVWLCGKPEHCARAWEAMLKFFKVMGLKYNEHKTGSVYLTANGKKKQPWIEEVLPKGNVGVGHLRLDPASGKWEIDQQEVEKHVVQLKKQLDGCGSILQWVQTWNSCIGRFFSHTFGEPAFCFGVDHVESILKTYKSMQNTLFADDTQGSIGAVEHIKNMVRDQFGVADIPDAFIYLPESMGGLGLRNPFIPLLEARKDLEGSTPTGLIQHLRDNEMQKYIKYKKRFEAFENIDKRINSLNVVKKGDHLLWKKEILEAVDPKETETYFSLEEFVRWREFISRDLSDLYHKLRTVPHPQGPGLDSDVSHAARQGHRRDPRFRETQWALQMYGDSLRRDYGGMQLVDQKYLPLGVLQVMRKRAVKWTTVL